MGRLSSKHFHKLNSRSRASWNSLTVGAYTTKVDITEPNSQGYIPIAPAGGLSPMTSSSSTWDKAWPLKPDVVFEGGNAAKDKISAVFMQSLGLLTAHNNPQERLFTATNATSAASAFVLAWPTN